MIENAFHNAEISYLSNLWPTPPTTPRLELIPEDEDRVGKLKALLNMTTEQTIGLSSALFPTDEPEDEDQLEYNAKKIWRKEERQRRRKAREDEQRRNKPPEKKELATKKLSALQPDETRSVIILFL